VYSEDDDVPAIAFVAEDPVCIDVDDYPIQDPEPVKDVEMILIGDPLNDNEFECEDTAAPVVTSSPDGYKNFVQSNRNNKTTYNDDDEAALLVEINPDLGNIETVFVESEFIDDNDLDPYIAPVVVKSEPQDQSDHDYEDNGGNINSSDNESVKRESIKRDKRTAKKSRVKRDIPEKRIVVKKSQIKRDIPERQIVDNNQLAAPIDNESYNKTYDTNNLDEEFNKRKKCRLVLRKKKIVNGTPGFCPVCEEYNHNIKLHLRQSHEICTREKLFCDHCPDVFFTKKDIFIHLRHHRVEAAKQELKERREAKKREANRPKAVMPNQRERLIFCSICDGFLANKFAYKVHLSRVHNTDEVEAKQIVCDVCGRHWPSRYRLRIHQERTHDKYRLMKVPQTFECVPCSLSFTTKTKISYHIKVTHDGVKPKLRMRPTNANEMSCKMS